MVSLPLRLCFLAILLALPLLLPGSEGWSGRVVEGDRLASQRRLLSALERYQQAERLPGGAEAVQVRLGRVHLRRGEAGEAAEAFRRAEARGAASREVLLGLAEALDRLGDVPAGLSVLRREWELRPWDAEAWIRLVERSARAGRRPEEIRALLGGDQGPSGDATHRSIADYLLGACVLEPGSPAALDAVRRAAAGGDQGAGKTAAELLEALDGAGQGGSKAIPAARALLAQGLVGPALAHLEGVSPGGSEESDGWALRGYALWRLGERGRAEEAVRRALELDPGHLLGRFLLGSLLRADGELEAAVRELTAVSRRADPNPAVYAELANALVALGDYGNAERALERAVEAAPESAEVRLGVARFYVDRQYRVEAALPHAGEAVRLSGGSSEALGTLGWALHLAGRAGEALDPLRTAVAKDPESALLRYRLGSVYEALGQRERARDQYLMVAELDGAGVHWRRAAAALNGLNEEDP